MRRVDAGVSQPVGDGAQIDARLEQMHGRAVPQTVRMDALVLEGGHLLRCLAHMALENEARAEAQAIGVRRKLWQILAMLAEIDAAGGNKEEAQVARVQAREVIDYIAAHAPAGLRTKFLNLPEVNAVMKPGSSA